jgi:hypothetical protein
MQPKSEVTVRRIPSAALDRRGFYSLSLSQHKSFLYPGFGRCQPVPTDSDQFSLALHCRVCTCTVSFANSAPLNPRSFSSYLLQLSTAGDALQFAEIVMRSLSLPLSL